MMLFEHQVKVLIIPFLLENVLRAENPERNLSDGQIINIDYVIEYMNYHEVIFVIFVVTEIFFEVILLFLFFFSSPNVVQNTY